MLHKYLFDKLLNEWGISKMSQVLTITLVGAGIGYLIGSTLIKSVPEKEKEYEVIYER